MLCNLASKVNFVWNYVNEIHKKNFQNYKQGLPPKLFSAFDINYLLIGASKELGLPAHTLQYIAEQYVSNRIKLQKSKFNKKKPILNWRSSKKSLGWIPFKNTSVKIKNNEIVFNINYQKQIFKIWKDRPLPEDAIIKCGSFNQDSRGRWFVSIIFSTQEATQHSNPKSSIGIDLGIKDAMTLSDGTKFQRANATKTYENKLAKAQRAKKKSLTRKIHNKIKNVRLDYYHKTTTQIVKQFEIIYVGDVSSQDIIDKSITPLTKGVVDASWYLIKGLLEYKAKKLGGSYREVNEGYTTQDCSSCGARCGPRGLEGLSIREWECSFCHAVHDRDVNSAKNILRIGHDSLQVA